MNRYNWEEPLDPHEDKDYSLDWSAEMGQSGDTINGSSWVLSAGATAAGITADQNSFGSTSSTVWLQVEAPKQNDAAFDPPGTVYTIENTITTVGGRTFQRTVEFLVKQQ